MFPNRFSTSKHGDPQDDETDVRDLDSMNNNVDVSQHVQSQTAYNITLDPLDENLFNTLIDYHADTPAQWPVTDPWTFDQNSTVAQVGTWLPMPTATAPGQDSRLLPGDYPQSPIVNTFWELPTSAPPFTSSTTAGPVTEPPVQAIITPHTSPPSSTHQRTEPQAGSGSGARNRSRSTPRHPCSECAAVFQYPKDRTRHESTVHDHARPFLCPVDGCRYHTRGFGRQDHLTRHLRSAKHAGL